ncbi:MAG: Rrf2 family transcriptional regulator [Mesorhizobium sp.]|uniref:Rrf2 family transcriptional regulator n=1 Tax=Mesorhizobium sp. TaxID=1871066 RepID=UPI001ACF5590|nr:Rrf2 family transcriptional regulator [Mesorhizobium sp.]MBN9220243.1 Rrf2 family transcriptional regulator [Mesorhizobium sp.]
MNRDSRLSGVLHVLLHMAHHSAPITSQTLARAMQTNPVVLRRIMAGLRDAGYVGSEKGHGGGWTLTRDPADITLRDIYAALGSPALFALGNRSANPQCLVEQAVNASLDKALEEAEQRLLARLGEVTLAMLDADIRARGADRRQLADFETVHAGAA